MIDDLGLALVLTVFRLGASAAHGEGTPAFVAVLRAGRAREAWGEGGEGGETIVAIVCAW